MMKQEYDLIQISDVSEDELYAIEGGSPLGLLGLLVLCYLWKKSGACLD